MTDLVRRGSSVLKTFALLALSPPDSVCFYVFYARWYHYSLVLIRLSAGSCDDSTRGAPDMPSPVYLKKGIVMESILRKGKYPPPIDK